VAQKARTKFVSRLDRSYKKGILCTFNKLITSRDECLAMLKGKAGPMYDGLKLQFVMYQYVGANIALFPFP